jgi:hypothetical protein
MSNEKAYVQVATDGSGKKVANVAVTEPQAVDASGNAQADLVRYEQTIGLANAEGDLIADPANLLQSILDAQTETNTILMMMLSVLDGTGTE